MKNLDNLTDYETFLQSTKENLIQLLKSHSTKHPIRYNLKLKATYHLLHTDNSAKNRAFETSDKKIVLDDNIDTILG